MSLRTSIRALLRERAFTAAVGLTLAIGLGACLAIFTVVKGVLFAPLPYLEAERLALVWMTNPAQGIDRDVISYPIFRGWRDHSRDVFSAMAAYSGQFASMVAGATPEEVRTAAVTEEFFQTVGVQARVGRTFTVDDFVDGRHRVAVLSHGLWQRAFGGREDVIGRDVILTGRPHTIIGVLPPDAEYPTDAEVWLPLAVTAESRPQMEARGSLWLTIIARLAPGVGLPLAQQRMTMVHSAQNAAFPDNDVPGTSTLVTLVRDDMVATAVRPLWLLQGAVLLVLLIACANVSNLFLARATARERDTATRAALGAGWRRLSREWFSETLVLTGAGALTGLVLAVWIVNLVVSTAPPQIPRLSSIEIDWTIVAAGALLTLVTALFIGGAPLARVARADVAGTLKEGGRTVEEQGGRARVRLGLVVAQIALALMLLVGAGLLLRSLAALLDTPSGFAAEGVLTARVALPPAKYQPAQRLQFWDRLRREVAALPGVERVAGVSTVLLSRLPNSTNITVEGRPDLPDGLRNWPVAIDSVTPGYFETVGMKIVRGRDITDRDPSVDLPVVVVNEALATQYFGTLDVIGRRIAYGSQNPIWMEIIGVVSNARRSGPELEARAETYLPHRQRPTGSMTLIVRGAGDPISLVPSIREVVKRLDPEQPLSRVSALSTLLDARLAERRFLLALLGGFAAVALLLSAIGIYGVMAYTVGRRRHEFGVRAALGASGAELSSLVLRQGLVVIGLGITIGVGGAFAATRLLERLLFSVSAVDPVVFVGVTLLLGASALLACWVPARRAANADPMGVLRQD